MRRSIARKGDPGSVVRLSAALLVVAALVPAAPARAQFIDMLFPETVPGFDQQSGVTVLSRLRPLYQEQGIRLGSFVVNGVLDQRVGYDSNITGSNNRVSSGLLQTTASTRATSDWSRNRLGVAAGVDNYAYVSEPGQNYTNYNASIGGGYTIGRHMLNVGYSHLRLHQLGTEIGSVATSSPITYDVDAFRSDYTIDSGRFTFVPNVDFRLYQFGSGVVVGQSVSQAYRDRTVLTGGVTTRYALSDQRALLLVVQGSSSHYIRPQLGPSNNSKTAVVLGGIDYQASGPWRYRLLAGAEVREFSSAQFGTRAGPVVEATVIWTPTGLTTLTASARRAIEDPQTELTAGYTFSTLRLVADHELRRNVLLQGRSTFQAVEYLQGNQSTTSVSFGAGVNWLLNRRVRVSANYDYTQQTGSSSPVSGTVAGTGLRIDTLTSGNYNRNLMLFGVHFAL